MSSATNHFGLVSRNDYLHQDGWKALDSPLHQQPFVINAMSDQKKQSAWQQRQCKVCKETWPTRSCLNSDSYTCYRCKRDKGSPKLLSAENDMDPGPVLLCLEGLTQVEQMLIARGCPVMCVYRKKGGQRGYRNHVLNFPHSLPTYVSDLPFLVFRMGQDNSHRDFKVRRTRVYDALLWSTTSNILY